MRAHFLLLLLFLAAPATAAEPCLPADFSAPRALTQTVAGCFESAATKSPVHYHVTFPAGYNPGAQQPYAIFLHGRGGNGEQFREFGGEAALNEHLQKGGAPFVVIAPTEPRHSYWKNGPKVEFGTARMVSEELVRHLETQPGLARGNRAHRAIIGISMGGHGSLFLAATKPETFSAVYAMSPVFRGPTELTPDDRPAFGTGAQYRRQDPVSLFREANKKGQPLFRTQAIGVEIGKDDPFFLPDSRTHRFLEQLQKSLGGRRVNLSRPGGHDAEYWQSAFRRAAEFLGAHFGEAKHPCAQGYRSLPQR